MVHKKKFKVLSYDVFDTCFARICGSQDFVFELLAKSVFGEEAEKSKIYDFVFERNRAEEIARKKCKKEDITLKSIYDNADFTLFTNIGTRQIINKELEIHGSILTPIYEIKSEIEFLHSQGKRIIYISDMYLPSNFILSVLTQHGFYKEGDLLYVSSEIGLTKATGHLYDYIKEKLNINYNQWLHKGDNEYSDIYIPKKKGIFTEKISYQYSYYENKTARLDNSCSDLTLIKAASCERATRLSFADSPYVRFAADFIAPMYVPFVYSILLDAEKRGIQRLFFIARDGYILLKIAEVFQESFPNIQFKYLYASRKSLYLPGINNISLTSLLEVLPINGTEAIIDLLSYLHLSNLNINIKEYIGLDKKTVIEKLLNNKDFNIALSKEYNEQSRLCIKYFEEIGLTMPNSALVDAFGTRKTVKFINNILRRNGYNNVFSYYFGVMEMRVIDQSNYKSIFYKERVQKTANDSIYCQKQNLIEQYFSMTNSERTSGYKLINGKIEPIFENDHIDNKYKQKISEINIAVCNKYASFYIRSKIEQHELCCYAAQAIFNYFFHIPRKEYLDALVGFCESDNGNKTKLLYKTSLIRLIIKRSKSGWLYGNLIYNCRFFHTFFTTILAYIWELRSRKRIKPY